MQVLNEQHEEDLSPCLLTSRQNRQKIQLIDLTVLHFKRIVHTSLITAIFRIAFFFVIFLYEDRFLCSNQDASCDGWSIIFYILASLMDLLVVLNDAQILRFLKKEGLTLSVVKQQLLENRGEITGTALGGYTIYLSVSSLIKACKFRSRSMNSISKTIRYLEFFITFCIFGQLALDSQYKNGASYVQTAILWGFILSIYYSVFEIDYAAIEAASGYYVDSKFPVGNKGRNGDGSSIRIGEKESNEWVQVKDNYVKRIRRPFEVVYFLTILLLLADVIMYFQSSVLSLITGVCILALVVQLIYQKHMQNRLLGLNLASIPKAYLVPQQVRYQLVKKSPWLHIAITSSTRVTIVLLAMACFRSPTLPVPHMLMLVTAWLLLLLGQTVKGEWVERGRLYRLRGEKQEETGGECSICLLNRERGQRILALPCFQEHRFHAECLRSWLKERRQCPLCRHSLLHYDIVN